MRTVVIAVLACVAAMLAVPAGALAADGSIAGEVTDAVTANGIEGVEVCAYQVDESGEDSGCSTTDVDGLYEITGLSPGEYVVEFWPGELNYQGQWFDGKSFGEKPDTVTVTSGGVTSADAALEPGGEIEGHVAAEGLGGQPIEGAEVVAFGVEPERFGGEAVTDGNGDYTIVGVPPGEYVVMFWTPSLNYLTQYFHDKPEFGEAEAVTVAANGVTAGIDADMELGGAISGTVTDAVTHGGLGEVEVCAFELHPPEFERCGETDSTGGYTLRRLPPGDYVVGFFPYDPLYPFQFFSGATTVGTASTITVTGGATNLGVNAALSKKGSSRPVSTAPVLSAPVIAVPAKKVVDKRCHKGFRKKTAKGVHKCVKVRKKKHRHHRADRRPRALAAVARLR
ncbi:MAG TPA: carboxypeptidase regulatory-like domain-containing protein [Solirubrobacterales bacterium]|nr:carboxypeptidase regulatory-like domain-containing protein [Solirubrobacterales bacterium]